MTFFTSILNDLSFFSTLLQAIKSVFSMRAHVYKAESFSQQQDELTIPVLEEKFIPKTDALAEYALATKDALKAFAYAKTALETVVPNCDTELAQYIPGLYFCRYIYPVATACAALETSCQIGSYLHGSFQKNKPN